MSDWDARWLDLADLVSSWSKDKSRKVGAVIVGRDKRLLAIGWNGFPRGIDDEVELRHQRPIKYKWTEHAERNAIYNAAAHGIRLEDATIYLPWFPCADCARAIVQSGITEVVCVEPDWNDLTWKVDFEVVAEMFLEAGILHRFVSGREAPRPTESASIQPTVRCSVCRFCESTGTGDYRCRHFHAVIMEPGYRYECTEGQEY